MAAGEDEAEAIVLHGSFFGLLLDGRIASMQQRSLRVTVVAR